MCFGIVYNVIVSGYGIYDIGNGGKSFGWGGLILGWVL